VEIWLVDESSGGEWRQARVMRRLCLLECASHSHESVRYYELVKALSKWVASRRMALLLLPHKSLFFKY
jgi:hypothetical protein